MRSQFPEAEIIKDIGSGLNFKRQGLRTLLEQAMRGDQLTIVVADRDRFTRFGFESLDFIVGLVGGAVMVPHPEALIED
ncbi:MAG: recombinase family protein [Chloroflexi bacterium]|nr:recombinase family protein [Chloroflexota bacterium]